MDYEVDVVVVGAGACGMVTALQAAASGARSVAIFEKSVRQGCNTQFSSGSLSAAGTRWQRAAGVDDDPERQARDILTVNGDPGSADLVRAVCGAAPAYLEWLADDLGYPVELGLDMPRAGQSVPRLHTDQGRLGGSRLVDCLRQAVERSPLIALVDRTPAVGLIERRDATGVAGVRVREADGERDVGASATVLAADGFAASPLMLARYCPDADGRIYGGVSTSTGDAIQWGLSIGARVANMASFLGHGFMVEATGTRLSPALPFYGAVLVNRQGHRFAEETASGYSKLAGLVASQPGRRALMIWDEDALRATANSELMRQSAEAKAFRPYNDFEALSTGTGVVVNPRFVSDGQRALRPPLYAAWVGAGILTTQGGLVVDPLGRVAHRAGGHIRGLYAGGGTASGISGPSADGYSSGNGLLCAMGLGWIIGNRLGASARS